MSSARRIAVLSSLGMGLSANAAIAIAAPQSVVWESQGKTVHDFLGTSLDVTGDFDGDGKPDLVAGAPSDEFSSIPGHVQLLGSVSGAVLFDLPGQSIGDRFGAAVASAGDVDGDGVDDWIVGAPADSTAASRAGAARVYSGATKARLFEWLGAAAGDAFGTAVAGAGDVDGDGVGDLVVTGEGARTVVVFSGKTGAVLWQAGGGTLSGRFGHALAVTNDLDGDGVRDLLVGAPDDTTLGTNEGAAYAFSGKTGALLLTLTASNSQPDFGTQVAGAKDVDGDGTPDVLVSNPLWGRGKLKNDQYGSVWIFSGKTGAQLLAVIGIFTGQQFGAALLAWTDADGDGVPDFVAGDGPTGNVRFISSATGVQIRRLDPALGNAPLKVVGDLDGDGRKDFVTALPTADSDYVHGPDAGVVLTFSGMDGSTIAECYGTSTRERRGASVAVLGDVDLDGIDDVLVGSPGVALEPGEVRVLSGRDASELRVDTGTNVAGRNGATVVALPDLDGDGFPEYVSFDLGGSTVRSGRSGALISLVGGALIYLEKYPPTLAAGTDPNGTTAVAVSDPGTSYPVSSVSVSDATNGNHIATFFSPTSYTGFGMSLAFLGDIDGDSIGDWMVGDPLGPGTLPGSDETGDAYVYSGGSSYRLYVLQGQARRDQFASSLSTIADLDGDGVRDVLIGARRGGGNDEGTVTVVSAKTGATIATLTGPVADGEFGRSLGTLGDVNHDGVEDFAVGANEPNGATTIGRVYVCSGLTFGLLAKFDSPDGFASFGPALCSNSSGIPTDVDHDGVPDLVVGTPDVEDPLHAGGIATLFRLDDLMLQATPTHVTAGQTITLDTRGGPATNLAGLFAVAFDGAPLVALAAFGNFDAAGAWSLSATVPAGLAGHTMTLRSYAFGFAGKPVDSQDALVTFE